ncbi:MAG: copper amine oxidase N-terminal domain-containing protein [Clostridiales bacterium]|nr:copper amine oxidase N-terminal domain-containing protein [Clostridiales bacterium]
MKRFIGFGLGVMLSAGVCVPAYCFESLPEVYVDCEEIEFPVEPEIKDGEVYVPIRTVLEAYLNRDISFKSTAQGKILIVETPDGRFSLNIDNGAYSYVIDNQAYGVVSLYDNTGEDKMGILSSLPYIKDGYTMVPVKEIIEILDGTVYYDENRISIISDVYTQNVEYAGEPFPVVFVFSDMDVYQSEKLADTEGYEELAALCRDYFGEDPDYSRYDEDAGEYDSENFGDFYEYFGYDSFEDDDLGEVVAAIFEGLYENKDNSLIRGALKDFLTADYSDILTADDGLTMEESLDNCVVYMYEAFLDSDYQGVIYVNSEYEKLARYVIGAVDFFRLMTDIMYSYDYTEEEYNDFMENSYYFYLIDAYIYEIYGEDVTDYLEMGMEDFYLEYAQ